jgi:hypothetical protein
LASPRGLWDALEQIDQAQYGQKYLYPGSGYFNGTVYVDDEDRDETGGYTDAWLAASTNVQYGYYYNYGPADENMAWTEHYVNNSPFPLKWEDTGAVIGDASAKWKDGSPATSAPNAMFFGGWYGWSSNSTAFQWLPGSAADNLISESFVGLEGNGSPTETVTQLGRGLTAAVGTVAEPYVDGHPRPNIFVYYLLQGYSFAEAAMLSAPYLGWMGLNIGDPLYTPLAPGKTPVKDTTTPTPASNFNPASGWWDTTGVYHLNLSINNSNGPEVASAVVQYGLTTSYGNTASSPAFYERPALTLTGLTPGLTYHMKLTLTNPVGTVWTSSDYVFTAPPAPIYVDTFTANGSLRYKVPTVEATSGTVVKWDEETGSATETGSGVTISGTAYFFLALTSSISNSNLQTTAGTYVLTANINATGPSSQWLALGFGASVNTTFSSANALVTLCGPASAGAGGLASTYYGTGTGSSGHPATGTVHGNGVDTISVILTTNGSGGATVSFSDTAGLLPQNSGGALTSAQLANINDLFIGSNGTAAGTFSDLTLTFTPADTSTTSVTSSLNPSDYGQSVTFTGTVAPGHAGTGTPGGTVTFMDGTTALGTGTLNASDIATFTTAALATASHSITAVYGGDANHTGSTSSALTQTVNQNSSTTAVTSSLSPSPSAQAVTFTATVTPASGSGETGTVQFQIDGSNFGTAVALVNGSATSASTSSLSATWHTITATYSGDVNFTGSSGTMTQTVYLNVPSPSLSGSGSSDPFELRLDPVHPTILQVFHNTPLSGPPTSDYNLSGLTTLTLATGSFNLASDLGTVNLTINSGATAFFLTTAHVPTLTINDGGLAALTGSGNVLVVTNLSTSGSGELDLGSGGMIWTGGGTAAETTLLGLINSGENGGTWTGPGVTSSAIAGSSIKLAEGIGLALGGDSFAFGSTWMGQPIGATDVLVRPTFLGDATLDGKVNIDDLDMVLQDFGQHYTPGLAWAMGDTMNEGHVAIDDLDVVLQDFGKNIAIGGLSDGDPVPVTLPASSGSDSGGGGSSGDADSPAAATTDSSTASTPAATTSAATTTTIDAGTPPAAAAATTDASAPPPAMTDTGKIETAAIASTPSPALAPAPMQPPGSSITLGDSSVPVVRTVVPLATLVTPLPAPAVQVACAATAEATPSNVTGVPRLPRSFRTVVPQPMPPGAGAAVGTWTLAATDPDAAELPASGLATDNQPSDWLDQGHRHRRVSWLG